MSSLVERLGGLFFAGRRSCAEDYSGLYCSGYLMVSIISCLCENKKDGDGAFMA